MQGFKLQLRSGSQDPPCAECFTNIASRQPETITVATSSRTLRAYHHHPVSSNLVLYITLMTLQVACKHKQQQ
jgi:hypothetical protein